MNEQNEQKNFEYTYSAPTAAERRETERIRKAYLPQQETDKLTRLRALDEKVKNPPMIWGLVFGVVGTLIFGLGLTMILEWNELLFGIAISVVGMIPIALAYPVYRRVLERGKKKYGQEILKLSEEILNENK